MKIRKSLLHDVATVESYSGEGAYGAVYATATAVRCNVDATRRLVRSADGEEAVSEATLFVHPDDMAAFTPESRVTLDGRASRVLAVSPQTLRGHTVFAKVAIA